MPLEEKQVCYQVDFHVYFISTERLILLSPTILLPNHSTSTLVLHKSTMQESTTSSSLSTVASPTEKQFPIIKIVMTQHGIQKSLRIDPLQTIWELKKSIIQKISPTEIPNIYNYAFLQPDVPGKTAAYLDEHQTLAHYKIGANVRK
jgi:hypothetical protein